jgi:hypothetical protein
MHADRFDIRKKKLAKGVGSIHARFLQFPQPLFRFKASHRKALKIVQDGLVREGLHNTFSEHRSFFTLGISAAESASRLVVRLLKHDDRRLPRLTA